jgi:hypothetical protein
MFAPTTPFVIATTRHSRDKHGMMIYRASGSNDKEAAHLDRPDELSRALKRHEFALAEYRHRVEANGTPDELERFHSSVVSPTLEECEQLADRGEGEEKRLVEKLRQCHKECVAASYELRNPRQLLFAEEYSMLAEKAKAHEAKCHEVRLALRKYRKGNFPR